jgi:hypothetical protein
MSYEEYLSDFDESCDGIGIEENSSDILIDSCVTTVVGAALIPFDCIGFEICIDNNVSLLTLNDSTFIKYIKNMKYTTRINMKCNRITFRVEFNNQQQHIFNKLLDKSDISIGELTVAIATASMLFDEYDVSRHTQNVIDRYIATSGSSAHIWTALTSKPDYNLTIYKSRTLPYFHLGCNDWVKASIDTLQGNYVEDTKCTADYNEPGDMFADITTHNNNFLEWGVLPIEKYPDIEELVDRIDVFHRLGLERQALAFFMKLMLSPKDCHIIKVASLWKIFIPRMEANINILNIIQYCYYFAMYILRQEETIMFSQVKPGYRVLFTLEEAHALPTFDNAHIERNPYILQLTNDTRISDSIPFHVIGKRRINSPNVFKRRFDLATAGVFKDIDLALLGAAITGSILIPCVHTSPLEKGFDNVDWNFGRKNIELKYLYMVDDPKTEDDYAFLHYLEYYYPGYCSLTDKEFAEQVLDQKDELIKNNEIPYEDDDINDSHQRVINPLTISQRKDPKPNNVDVTVNTNIPGIREPVKPVNELVTVNVVKQSEPSEQKDVPVVGYNQLSDIDISITARSANTFKTNALSLFYQIKANCAHRGEIFIKEIKTITSTKFKIYGLGLSRPIDVFCIPYSPVKMVKKFHVHCVKMYYDNSVTMFRSCVASLLSGVNETYKWFSCNKVPIDVLLKYAQRGITIILNSNERRTVSKFLQTDTRWGLALKKLKINPTKIYCCVTPDHPFFHPGLHGSGIRKTLRNFQRYVDAQYTRSLSVGEPVSITPYGDLLIKDNNKQHAPNPQFITACLDYTSTSD